MWPPGMGGAGKFLKPTEQDLRPPPPPDVNYGNFLMISLVNCRKLAIFPGKSTCLSIVGTVHMYQHHRVDRVDWALMGP